MAARPVDLRVSRLTMLSGLLASRLFHRLPELETHARMEPSSIPDEFDLLVDIPSPSGASNPKIYVWMERGVEPSVEFGDWHTHARVWTPGEDHTKQVDGIVDLIQAILADQVVLIYDVGGSYDGVVED